jgi:hypothetical protein
MSTSRSINPRPAPRPARLAPACLVAGLLLASGCTVGRYTRLADPVPTPYDRAPLVKVLEHMDERRNAVDTLVAQVNVLLRDQTKGKEQPLWGAYIGDRKGNLRLRIKLEEKLLMDLAIYDDTVSLWLPRKDRFYQAPRKDVAAATGSELALLAQVGSVHELFFPRAWTPQAVERRVKLEDGQEVVKVIERPGFIRRAVRTLVIAPDQPVAQEVRVFDQRGRPIGTVKYADYRFPGPRAGEHGGATPGVPYPGQLTLVAPDGQRSLRMEVEELTSNSPVLPKHFSIPLPEGQKVLDLGEALRGGKCPWD